MDNYSDALNISYRGPAIEVTPSVFVVGDDVQAVQVVEDQEGSLRLAVTTFWSEDPRTLEFHLVVPVVTPVRFSGDDDLFGEMVRLPYSRTTRFCHPLLVCPFAEQIAADRQKGAARLKFSKPADWDWAWLNWYGRVRRAVEGAILKIMTSQQVPTTGFVRMQFRRAISNLITPTEDQTRPNGWSENGSSAGDICAGVPLTDDCLIYRQMYEVRLGFPDVPNNDQLYEQIKRRYVAHVDAYCDVCWTGKNHVAREVGRVFEGDPVSFITGRPMPRLLRGMNPLAQIASPARVWREDRSCGGWLTFAEPVEPPIRAQGVTLPQAFQERITTLVTAIVDIPGFNVFGATEQDSEDYPGRVAVGEEISLDGLLVTKTGQKKLKARVTTSDLKTAEEFLPRMEDLQELPGFRYEEDPQEVECLSDGTRVFNYQYRYWWDQEIRCRYDKVKCLCGGIKGVTRPIHPLYTEINGEVVAIDMVISERTALSKGATDLFLYPLLAHAGITEVDPTWSKEQLVEMAAHGLKQRDLPLDGRFPIYTSQRVATLNGKWIDEETANTLEALGQPIWRKSVKVLVGEGIVGPLPFCRAQETEWRQSSASSGLSLNCHARVLGGVPLPLDEKTERAVTETVRFFNDHAPLAAVGAMDSAPEEF